MEPGARELTCLVNNSTITIQLESGQLKVRARSDNGLKLFTGQFTLDSFPEDVKVFGGCDAIMNMIEESIEQKQTAILSDIGELKFPFVIKLGKTDVEKKLVFALTEIMFSETEKNTIKIERLEKQIEKLHKQNISFRQENASLKGQLANIKESLRPKDNKVLFEVDETTLFFKKFKLCKNIVSVKDTAENFYPLFSKNRLLQQLSEFQFEIVNYSNKLVRIGIATTTFMASDKMISSGSLSLGNQYIKIEKEVIHHRMNIFNRSDKITMIVDLVNYTVEWEQTYPIRLRTAKMSIPVTMRDQPLYPYIAVKSNEQCSILKIN